MIWAYNFWLNCVGLAIHARWATTSQQQLGNSQTNILWTLVIRAGHRNHYFHEDVGVCQNKGTHKSGWFISKNDY